MTEHPSGAPRAVASSPSPRRAAVDEIERLPRPTVAFYRDLVGLPVIESFAGSYGEDGTIFGPPAPHAARGRPGPATGHRPDQFHQLLFHLADPAAGNGRHRTAARSRARSRLRPAPVRGRQTDPVYLDPGGRAIAYAP